MGFTGEGEFETTAVFQVGPHPALGDSQIRGCPKRPPKWLLPQSHSELSWASAIYWRATRRYHNPEQELRASNCGHYLQSCISDSAPQMYSCSETFALKSPIPLPLLIGAPLPGGSDSIASCYNPSGPAAGKGLEEGKCAYLFPMLLPREMSWHVHFISQLQNVQHISLYFSRV